MHPLSKSPFRRGDLIFPRKQYTTSIRDSVFTFFFFPFPPFLFFRSDPTSHLRAIVKSNEDLDFPQDFNSRCSFVISGEKGTSRPMTTITYGSFVRLKHKTTNCTVIALHQEDDFDSENCYNTVAMRSSLSSHEEMASTW